jgi:hypothetical protein
VSLVGGIDQQKFRTCTHSPQWSLALGVEYVKIILFTVYSLFVACGWGDQDHDARRASTRHNGNGHDYGVWSFFVCVRAFLFMNSKLYKGRATRSHAIVLMRLCCLFPAASVFGVGVGDVF